MRRAILVIPIVLTLLLTTSVLADQVYHSERLDFAQTDDGRDDGHPALRHGQVVNIHANGPVVGALERYMVSGAKPNTDYAVVLDIFAPGCDGDFVLRFPIDGLLETDSRGVGHHQGFFSVEDLVGFFGGPWGVQYILVAEDTDAYASECTTVFVDSHTLLSTLGSANAGPNVLNELDFAFLFVRKCESLAHR